MDSQLCEAVREMLISKSESLKNMNSKFQWAASGLFGACAVAVCAGTPTLAYPTGGTMGGPVVVIPTIQSLPNLLVTRIDLDQSGSGSVFVGQGSSKTTYVRLKLQLSNNGGSSASPGKVTIRTFQQYGVQTRTTTYTIPGVIGANGSTSVTVLAPIERIAKGWETGFIFEVQVDSWNVVRESNETDNLSIVYGNYGQDLLGQYLNWVERAIGRGQSSIPKPKPIRDPGFFIPHTIPTVQKGLLFR